MLAYPDSSGIQLVTSLPWVASRVSVFPLLWLPSGQQFRVTTPNLCWSFAGRTLIICWSYGRSMYSIQSLGILWKHSAKKIRRNIPSTAITLVSNNKFRRITIIRQRITRFTLIMIGWTAHVWSTLYSAASILNKDRIKFVDTMTLTTRFPLSMRLPLLWIVPYCICG